MTRSPELMTWAQAATVLGCSVRTLQRIRSAGLIGFTRVGSTVYFTPEDIGTYIESQRVTPASKLKRKAS